MLRSFGLGLGLETFAKSLRVLVSENLVSEKKSRFRFRKNLVSEKSLGFGFGKFGFGKKSLSFGFEKIWYRKKSRSRFQKIWSRKRKNPNNKNSARNDVPIVIQCCTCLQKYCTKLNISTAICKISFIMRRGFDICNTFANLCPLCPCKIGLRGEREWTGLGAESHKPHQRVSNADRKVFANPEIFCDKFIIA